MKMKKNKFWNFENEKNFPGKIWTKNGGYKH